MLINVKSRQQWPHDMKLKWFKEDFKPHFDEWVINPAQRLVFDANEYMPAFIWISCAIDWLSGFWWGSSTRNEGGKPYIGFIQAYFPSGKYDAEGLYDSLRNGLVHMYTIKGKKYVLTDHKPDKHLQMTKTGTVVLNMEDFFNDWVSAKNMYFDAVESDPLLLDKLIDRHEREGFLGSVPLDI